MITQRPWGSFEVLTKGIGYQVKRLVIKPKQKISLQSHMHRDEHWFIASGQGRVIYGELGSLAVIHNVEFEYNLHQGESFDIEKKALHRMENTGDKDLVIIEVQTGKIIEESDIKRYIDVYGRAE